MHPAKCKANRDGTWREGWEGRHDLVKRGYWPSWVRLYYADTLDGRRNLTARCKDLQGQMLAWAANEGSFSKRGYDGSIRSLAHQFQADEDSPYRRMKWNSQTNFDKTVKLITATVGERRIGKLLGTDLLRWHRNWAAAAAEGKPQRPWRAKHCVDAVRRMIAYGVTLGYDDCMRADTILGKMRFPTPPARRAKLEVEQVNAIRTVAHEMGAWLYRSSNSIAVRTFAQTKGCNW